MPHLIEHGDVILAEGEEATVCVWMVLDGQPVSGAEVAGVVNYADFQLNLNTFEIGPHYTAANGIAILTFTVPRTPAGEVELEVAYDGFTYTYDDAYFLKMQFKNPR